MIYKLPKDKKALSAEILKKIALLKPDSGLWYQVFDDCSIDKDLYDKLISDIKNKNTNSNTIQDKKCLEDDITKAENILLGMLDQSCNENTGDDDIERAKLLTGNGILNIRAPKGIYPVKMRKSKP